MIKEAKNIYLEFESHKYDTIEHLQNKIEQIDKHIKKSYIGHLKESENCKLTLV
ncbi:hypothetical protein tpqmel_0024 [Candidatus Gastranaerophilus sp. (ex Termes propinquus)]|nr:hypothetical protein tpqmel_0024 [Candidatus Gastranaerophilus sp. (ex Termes propinquus)]